MIPSSLVEELMREHSVPGLAVGVVLDDAEELAGFGITSNENPLAVDANTLFQIGSITKTYTAAAAMRLVEAGLLSMDEPVRTYISDLRLNDESVAARVTMRHLLSHVGGWAGDYFALTSTGDDALELMVGRLADLEQLTPLGEVWAYNNAGFYIAGHVIQILTGKPFELALQELVLEPLGLEHSLFFADAVITHRFAVGHDRDGAVARPWTIGRAAAPAGGLVASAADVLKYARGHWASEGFLTSDSLFKMRTPQRAAPHGLATSVGLAWYLFEARGRVFLTHGGNTRGQRAFLVISPDDRFALTILTNCDSSRPVIRRVGAEVLRACLNINGVQPPLVERNPSELKEYVGRYESRSSVAHLTIGDGHLTLQSVPKGGFPEPTSPPLPAPPPTRLAFIERDTTLALDPPFEGDRADFLRDTRGEIIWYRLGGRLMRRASA